MTNIIMSKLQERIKQREQGAPDDRITNTMSTFKTVAEKRLAFNKARENHTIAFDYKLNKIPLASVKFNDVDFIGGEWRF